MTTIVSNLNPEQQEAVTFWKENGGSPLLILAGAGSGKTRVLTHRAAWLIREKNISPENMLLITFTNKAAGEMKERITQLLTKGGIGGGLPLATTYHSFCARILRRDGKHLGIPPSFVIYDDDDQRDAIKQILVKLNLVSGALKPAAILATISSCKNEMIDVDQYESIAASVWQKNVALIYRQYQKLLLEAGALDFDDLLTYSVKLLKETPVVLSRYQNSYQHLLVDEWQDTNRAQYQLTKLLSGKHKNLTAVGDAAQSIYSWRGADHRNIEYLARDFPEMTIINLEQNYRSTQNILDAAYHIISKNTSHPILKLWTKKGKGEKIALYQARSEQDEASFVVNEINRQIENWRIGKNEKSNHPISQSSNNLFYSNFAILYRTNAQSRVLEEALLHAGIPYILVGGVRFYARREIKDVLSYLRVVVNDKDPVSRARAEKIGKGRFSKFVKKFEKFDVEGYSTLELLDSVLETTSYLDLYDPDESEDAGRLENIKELRSVATQFPNVIEFLEQIALVENIQNEKGKPINDSIPSDAITLMTAHAAKGLEFAVVFIVGLEEGLFPHSRSTNSREELEEERRLCYVGITRAKVKLYITFASRRLIFGQRGNSVPSRFLADIPEHLFDNPLRLTPTPWLYES